MVFVTWHKNVFITLSSQVLRFARVGTTTLNNLNILDALLPGEGKYVSVFTREALLGSPKVNTSWPRTHSRLDSVQNSALKELPLIYQSFLQ